MVYRSRISVLLSVLIIGIMGGTLGLMIYHLVSDPFEKRLFAVACISILELLVACLLVGGMFYSTRYIIEGTKLEVKVAILHFGEGDLTKLESITPTRTLLSAPACSLKRIRLDFNDGTIMVISPRRQSEFLDQIRRINPKVHIDETLN